MLNSIFILERPKNEPILSYAPGTKEREELKEKLKELSSKEIEIPLIIGGKEIKTGNLGKCIMPHNHKHVLAHYHMAGEKEIKMAIESALKAKEEWENYSYIDRISIFLKAAELLSTTWRSTLNAAAMLDLDKNVYQAEIDSACELIDFFRFNSYYATKIYTGQPQSSKGILNRMEYRALDGFIFAVPPFNFASISGNLPTAPAIMGNVVLWKPASSAVYTAYYIMKLLQEAGLPDGVINFIPGPGSKVGEIIFSNSDFGGVHFTGSVNTFDSMWEMIGKNIRNYKSYPRIVGETGGKDFVIAHHTANRKALITALIRGAFEYQGQKCSAASRTYISKSVWNNIKDELIETTRNLKIGSPTDFSNFVNAVIDKAAFKKITDYIEYARKNAEILVGGKYDDSIGYFIDPTIILTDDPHFKTMEEEIFGPVLTVYIYDDDKYEDILKLCDQTSPYGLTGSIFAQDRKAIQMAERILVHAAGNFYINDKPTGAVVDQQPFGGSRGSGTNDKAGSYLNLLRWTSARSIKENFNPPENYTYPFMK
ncbi:delta-1-pyrroline-5-carboxylate dehydrogenase [Marinitoga hydrogenitolerans DSM 16785]|uniref:L-glutamate gamma-semialdehyde dehydrogenase n=1 Tax=Marinitoga hydrogenitolerans (strain DSM 16785 / JCM 12826 / AT1271) TaxID=1122195 RepID=A0A1M4XSL4_MARH1|nr:L-glutamate gamma-semialdehyde dehydrogenase [Marinitoga hydrogenitolerans]SHE96438.1 delta-1-pyrroline-5-carboxylate dehydrogenase [Marinitoga hydrogenitolerans DSM 16785]